MSLFSEVPASNWVASNRSAFAIRDGFPVTEGHTLVVPRREIVTWWEAGVDERNDLFALVDVVKAQLEAASTTWVQRGIQRRRRRWSNGEPSPHPCDPTTSRRR